jgi:hypothetical protein
MYWYRSREQEFKSYFSQDGNLVYCCNIPGLTQKFGVEYKVNEWRLSLTFQKKLKSCPFAQRQQLRFITYRPLSTPYENLELVLTKIRYTAHDWMICGDLNVLCILLVQQASCTKYPCFMREWDSRARSQHCEQKHWTPRISLEPGSKNIL